MLSRKSVTLLLKNIPRTNITIKHEAMMAALVYPPICTCCPIRSDPIIPGIRPTIVILLIMAIGNIVGSGFDRPFALQNNLVMSWAEVISTYVYRYGIKGLQFSLTTAVGLFQSVVGVIFLLAANTLSRKLGERGLW